MEPQDKTQRDASIVIVKMFEIPKSYAHDIQFLFSTLIANLVTFSKIESYVGQALIVVLYDATSTHKRNRYEYFYFRFFL